jgi:hypothetical protein
MGLEARADALGGALDLDGAGDDPAQIAQAIPALGQRIVAPGFRQIGKTRRCTLSSARCPGPTRPPRP